VAKSKEKKAVRAPARSHLLIAGTGRAGTSFLVRYLTGLGLDTHMSRHGDGAWDSNANAGLEDMPVGLGEADLPYVIKSPWLTECIDSVLADKRIKIAGVIIPVRDLAEAAASRVVLEYQAMHRAAPWMAENEMGWSTSAVTPGGVVFSLHPIDQARMLALGFHHLVQRLVKAEISFVLVDFPRFVQDGEYLFKALSPLLPPEATRERALSVHAEIADPAKARVGSELEKGDVPPAVPAEHPAESLMPDRFQAEAIALRRELASSRQQISDRDRELATLRQSSSDSGSEIAGLRAAISEKDAELAGLRTGISEKDVELAGLRAGMSEKDAELAALRASISERDTELANMRAGMSATDVDVLSLREGIAEKDAELASLHAGMSEKDAELASLRAEMSAKDVQTASLRAGMSEKDVEIASLRAAMSEKDVEGASLRGEISEKDVELASLRAGMSEKDIELVSLREAAAEKGHEIATLREAATEKDREVSALRDAAREQDREIARLQEVGVRTGQEIAALQEKLRERDRELAAQRELVSTRDMEIAELRSSISWMAAAPIRWVGNSLQQLKAKRAPKAH